MDRRRSSSSPPERRRAQDSRSRSPAGSLERAATTRSRSPLPRAREQDNDGRELVNYRDTDEEGELAEQEAGHDSHDDDYRNDRQYDDEGYAVGHHDHDEDEEEEYDEVHYEDELKVFSDASIAQRGRPHTGIAMAVFVDNRWIIRAAYAGLFESNEDAECRAANMAFEFAQNVSEQRPGIRSIQIVTDNQNVYNRLRYNHAASIRSPNDHFRRFEARWQVMTQRGVHVNLQWVGANWRVRGNALADEASWEIRKFFENTPWQQGYQWMVFRREESMAERREEEYWVESNYPCPRHQPNPCACVMRRPHRYQFLPQIRAVYAVYGQGRHGRW